MLLVYVRTAPTRLSVAILACVAFLGVTPGAVRRAPTTDIRALWVTRTTLATPDTVRGMVRAAKDGGFNALLVQVRGRGDAYYASDIEPRAADLTAQPSFDPLREVLTQAHAAGLQVHAWLAVNLVSSAFELPASRNHIVYRSPEWLMVPREMAGELRSVDPRSPEYVGRLARWTRAHATEVEGLYASPLAPGAAAHVADVAAEIAGKYDIDGVHLDYVRFPSDDFDYSPTALREFARSVDPDLSAAERRALAVRSALDPIAYTTAFPERWNRFRRSRLSALVMRVRTAVKSRRPGAVVSAAVVPDVQTAYDSRFQDWRTWLDQSIIDVLCPMAYSTDARVFEQQVGAAQDYAGGHPVWAGIGAYRLSTADTLVHIATARRAGVAGTILFSYDALVAPPNSASTLTDLGRSAFGRGSF
jgi:uncharacterized lipoprotein YddW (UPF0748 family)